jgi:hypothetical protein
MVPPVVMVLVLAERTLLDIPEYDAPLPPQNSTEFFPPSSQLFAEQE